MHEFVLLIIIIITNAVFDPTFYFLSPTIHKRVTHGTIGNFMAISQRISFSFSYLYVLTIFNHIDPNSVSTRSTLQTTQATPNNNGD